MTDEVLLERRDGVLIITMNRPEAKNAVTEAVAKAIAAAVDELDSDDDLRVGVLTGAGGRFCAGMAIQGFLRGEKPVVEGSRHAGLPLHPPRQPFIAAAAGWGPAR